MRLINTIQLAFSTIIGVMFVAAGSIKVVDPQKFSDILIKFELLPERIINPAALTLPWLEVFTGLLLLIPKLRRLAASFGRYLIVAFLGALVYAWMRGLDIDCGCFGDKFLAVSTGEAIIRDILLFAMLSFIRVNTGGGRNNSRNEKLADGKQSSAIDDILISNS